MAKTNQTNYVLVIDFDPSYEYLEDQLMVGWDNDNDCYTEVEGFDLLTPTGRLKKTDGVCCIRIDKWIGCYVDDDLNWMKKTCESSKDEGYDCIVCRIEKNTDKELIVVPV